MSDKMKRVEAAVLSPEERRSGFGEVALGYTAEQARAEAERCLHCKNRPCMNGCPVGIKIPDFIAEIKNGNFGEAYNIISKDSSLPAVCGRVCPQENQCEKNCVRGIKGEAVAIGRLERFAADWHGAHPEAAAPVPEKIGRRAAIIGSGPSGLACAGELAAAGWSVTVFEALHTEGGVLVYGIPEFRLPKEIVRREIDGLRALGVEFVTNAVAGRAFSVGELLGEISYDAVFIGSGAGLPLFLGIPGENAVGVFSANEFLTRVNLMKAYREDSDTPVAVGKHVAVVGGGNVAMDAARCALRLGAEDVTVVYRRSEAELPARAEEVRHAKEEGIRFCFLSNPVEVLQNDDRTAAGLLCVKMALGEPDQSGRRSVSPIEGSEFRLEADCVIVALGTSPNPLIKSTTPGLDVNRRGGIVVDEATCRTSVDGVYAGGDAVTGSATVILAMGAGKRAAKAIIEHFPHTDK